MYGCIHICRFVSMHVCDYAHSYACMYLYIYVVSSQAENYLCNLETGWLRFPIPRRHGKVNAPRDSVAPVADSSSLSANASSRGADLFISTYVSTAQSRFLPCSHGQAHSLKCLLSYVRSAPSPWRLAGLHAYSQVITVGSLAPKPATKPSCEIYAENKAE